jgi:hypothetical protein
MRKLFYLIAIIAIVSLSSCARSCQGLSRDLLDNTSQDVRVTMYSGGVLIKMYEFNGIISNSANSDGYYFYYKGKLVEVSGDILIEYL